MLHAKIALASGVMAASLLGGIALGGYTTGGFKEREQVDVIANAASRVRPDDFREVAAVEGPVHHVCSGCDAKLYREDAWYRSDAAYETDDEWAREERESDRVVRAALDDEPARERDDGFAAGRDLESDPPALNRPSLRDRRTPGEAIQAVHARYGLPRDFVARNDVSAPMDLTPEPHRDVAAYDGTAAARLDE